MSTLSEAVGENGEKEVFDVFVAITLSLLFWDLDVRKPVITKTLEVKSSLAAASSVSVSRHLVTVLNATHWPLRHPLLHGTGST